MNHQELRLRGIKVNARIKAVTKKKRRVRRKIRLRSIAGNTILSVID